MRRMIPISGTKGLPQIIQSSQLILPLCFFELRSWVKTRYSTGSDKLQSAR